MMGKESTPSAISHQQFLQWMDQLDAGRSGAVRRFSGFLAAYCGRFFLREA